MAAPKGRKKPQGSGRVAGTPNKKTQLLTKRLDEMDCDPLEVVVSIISGEDPGEAHPFGDILQKWILKTRKAVTAALRTAEKDKHALSADLEQLLYALEKLSQDAQKALETGYIPVDLRAKLAKDLLDYIYPKRRAIEIEDLRSEGLASELTDDELAAIAMSGIGEKKRGPAKKKTPTGPTKH